MLSAGPAPRVPLGAEAQTGTVMNSDLQRCVMIIHVMCTLNGHVWVVAKSVCVQERFAGQKQCSVTHLNYKSVSEGAGTASGETKCK